MFFKMTALSIAAASAVLSQSVWAQGAAGAVGAPSAAVVVVPGAVVASSAAVGALSATTLIAIGTAALVVGVAAGTSNAGATGTQ